jgi:hypothetical protein
MPKRSSKDINQTAASIVAQHTGQSFPTSLHKPKPKKQKRPVEQVEISEPMGDEGPFHPHQKNAYAVALGRLGGLVGGNARKKALSKERRKEIAKKAAKARWKTK